MRSSSYDNHFTTGTSNFDAGLGKSSAGKQYSVGRVSNEVRASESTMMNSHRNKHDDDDDDIEDSMDNANESLIKDQNKNGDSSSGGILNGDIPLCGFLSVKFYQPYFDVDTDEVIVRLLQALFYCKRENNFVTLINDKPDAYGPFWIATTLIFSVAVTSHITSWISSWMNNKNWEYDFQSIVTASSVVYGFAIGAPFLYYLLFRHLESNVKLITAVCLYGYTSFVFIPATMLCLLPSHLISWLALLGAAAASTLFLLRNLGPIIVTSLGRSTANVTPYLVFIGAAPVMFALFLKFAFYFSY